MHAVAEGADKVDHVVRMAGQLADKLLDDQVMQRELPGQQVKALVEAAMLLEEQGVEWPPMMMQVLQGIDAAQGAPADNDIQDDGPDEPSRARRFMRRFVPFMGGQAGT